LTLNDLKPVDGLDDTGRRRRPASEFIVERLRRRADEITRAMVERYRKEIPEYAALDDAALYGDVFRTSLDNIHILLSNMSDGRALSVYEISKVRIAALRRAHEGLPLEAMLHAYRLWARTIWAEVIAETDTSNPAEAHAALVIGSRIFEHADEVATGVTQAYRDESAGVTYMRDILGRDLLEQLITGGDGGAAARAELERRGITLRDSYVVVGLRQLPESSAALDPVSEPLGAARVRRYVESVRMHLTSASGQVIVGVRDEGLIVFYPMDDAQAFDELRRQALALALEVSEDGVAVGIGDWHTGPDGISSSYVEARQATDVAIAGKVRGRAVVFTDVLIDDLLNAQGDTGRVIAAMVQPLEDYDAAHQANLMDTLGAYFEAGFNLTRAASTLYVRANTVVYRLKRIHELTGRDPLDPNDLMLLVLAWKLRQRK
jgi:hypothetical protein